MDNPDLQSMEEDYDSIDDEYMQEFFWKPEEHTVPEAEGLWPGVCGYITPQRYGSSTSIRCWGRLGSYPSPG